MAWEERKGQLYYYRKERIGDKVVSRYVGKGFLGALYDMVLQEDRQQRQAIAEEKKQWEQLEANLEALKQQIDLQLRESGLHRPNWGRWMRRRTTPPPN